MKIKNDFVTNSSSCSFIIKKADLNYEQVEKIINHLTEGKQFGLDCDAEDTWSISVEGPTISGYTLMDNFDMFYFLKKIGVPEDKIEWGNH